MSSLLAENLSSRLPGLPQNAWGKKAWFFTVATGASQLTTACVLAMSHLEAPAVWLAVSGMAVGVGAFVVPWGRGRWPSRNRRARAAERQRLELLQALPLPARSRYLRLMVPVRRAGDLLGQPVDPCSGAGAPRRLEHLLWLYLRLLTASQQLHAASQDTAVELLEAEAAGLRGMLAEGGGNPVLRSRRAAVELIEQRLGTHRANEARQEEIACDLRRIEHHCALFLGQAAHAGSMGGVSLLIDLDLSAGSSLDLFSEASQHLLQESGQYYLEAA